MLPFSMFSRDRGKTPSVREGRRLTAGFFAPSELKKSPAHDRAQVWEQVPEVRGTYPF